MLAVLSPLPTWLLWIFLSMSQGAHGQEWLWGICFWVDCWVVGMHTLPWLGNAKCFSKVAVPIYTPLVVTDGEGNGTPLQYSLPGQSHGWRSLVGCGPWGRQESDTTERLHFHFSLACIGEGNGNPLQCSCLENPRDGGAWWAAIYGVAQSRTRLKWLSSSSSSSDWILVLPTSSPTFGPGFVLFWMILWSRKVISDL